MLRPASAIDCLIGADEISGLLLLVMNELLH